MEETKEQQSLHRFLQCCIYFSVLVEVFLYYYVSKIAIYQPDKLEIIQFAEKLVRMPFFRNLYNSKLFTLLLICLVSI